MSKAIIEITKDVALKKSDLIATFSDKEKLQPYIDKIKEAAQGEVNLKTDKGRKEIASRARKVSTIKKALSDAGKDSVADLKAKVANVNSGIKFLTESLDEIRDETREPLTRWEEEQKKIEAERVAGIQEQIAGIRAIGTLSGSESVEEISSLIDAVSNIDCSEGFDEFAQEALRTISEVKEHLASKLHELTTKKMMEEKERELAAQQRSMDIEQNIAAIKQIAFNMMNATATEAHAKIDELQRIELTSAAYGDRVDEAAQAIEMVIQQLKKIAQMNGDPEDIAIAESQPAPKIPEETRAPIASEMQYALIGLGCTEELARSIEQAIKQGRIPNAQYHQVKAA